MYILNYENIRHNLCHIYNAIFFYLCFGYLYNNTFNILNFYVCQNKQYEKLQLQDVVEMIMKKKCFDVLTN